MKIADGGRRPDEIFVDFNRAFDGKPLGYLPSKLVAHGTTGNVLNWIRYFLVG